jgi:hypothetical protein
MRLDKDFIEDIGYRINWAAPAGFDADWPTMERAPEKDQVVHVKGNPYFADVGGQHAP